MHGEHDPTQDRRPGAARRGRRPYGDPAEPPRAPAGDPAYGTADDPFAYGSWISLDVRAPHRPAPPAEPAQWSQWSWPELPRDRLLRSALVVGFLAAAGIGVWSSGWTPLPGRTPEQAGPYRPAPLAVTAAPPVTGRPVPPPAAAPPHAPHAPQAARPARARPPATSAPRQGHRPRPAAGPRHSDPGRARDRHGTQPPAGADRPRPSPAALRRPSETAGTARAEKRPRRPGRPSSSGKPEGKPEGKPARGPGGADRGARPPAPVPRPGRTAAPAAPPERAPGHGTGSLTVEDRLGAAYACRHLGPDDWRYAYCVTAWNDYRKRVGLP
ncbi:hypothetical protein GCM10017673_57100 [Streptosporangium violaceochromogenes]|nr:hypothetical protein GCM10017673_57100 [Streptosporangium violaceochromogenes]